MTKEGEALTELYRLFSAQFDAEQVVLGRERAVEQELKRSLEAISLQHQTRAKDPLAHGDAAWLAGADMQWALWAEQRRALINSKIAESRAHQHRIESRLRKFFGKKQALASLLSIPR